MGEINALTFSKLSMSIYMSSPDFGKFLTYDSLEFCTFDLDTELGFVRVQNDIGIFVYKGSSSLLDWEYNFHIAKDEFAFYQDTKVHRGIYAKAKLTLSYIKKKIKGYNLKQVYFTGHSLGGALSVISAAQIEADKDNNTKVSGVYLIGSPKVGDHNFMNEYNKRLGAVTYSYVNKNDIVPKALPTWLNYYPVGQEIKIDAGFGITNRHFPWTYIYGIRRLHKINKIAKEPG